ncbi:MAG TPA: hypothetical protein DD381_01085 [Lentisphaeria bacterium]|nr:MAG: hypothetical protein A2X47_05895 [Lentisphaerae bacterium GWF2_38_69]HBM14937.1 hypothetical protein [Lentisphaeria bacterium]
MQQTNFSKSLAFDSCVININYITEPKFKITSVHLESLLEGKKTAFSDNYKHDRILDSVISSIFAYFEENKPLHVKLEYMNMADIAPYYRKVLETLFYQIPQGKVVTYKKLSEFTGNPNASRAVGTAMSTNPFPLLIPCHRVLKSDLKIGNYGSGQKLKLFLLEKETARNSFKDCSLVSKEILV